jgi:hydrogenase nickel incorporation protein HypA/HybF
MHEVSICQSIIDSLENEFGEDQLPFIRGINLKVGVLSCVEPVVLKHVFSMMVADSAMPQAELQIEIVDVQAECKQCGNEFKVDRYTFICPACGRPSSNVTQGNELQITKIILEEPEYEKTIE